MTSLTCNNIVTVTQVLAEFQGVQEHRQFMKNIGKEKELKSRIKDLQRFVSPFINSFSVFIMNSLIHFILLI